MNREEITAKVTKIITEHLGQPAEKVTEEASYLDDLGADSLDLIELVMAFEEEFGVEVADEETDNISTVKDSIDLLFAKVNAK